MRPGFAAQRSDFIGDLLGVFDGAGNAGDIRAFGGELQCDGATDTASGASHYRNLIGQLAHGPDVIRDGGLEGKLGQMKFKVQSSKFKSQNPPSLYGGPTAIDCQDRAG